MMDILAKPSSTKSFTLKGGLYTLTTLHLEQTSISALSKQLAETVKQAPKFFDHTPVVVDLQAVATNTNTLNMNELATCLREFGLVPVGMRGGSEKQRKSGVAAGWALMPEPQKGETGRSKSKGSGEPAHNRAPTKIITQPVRSGQQIYAQGGDLIVLAPVSAGAEVLADGNIHVYAPLRGRALAGVLGDTEARIFCHHLAAELIAIAGHYKVSDQMKEQLNCWEKNAIIYLTDDHLTIQAL